MKKGRVNRNGYLITLLLACLFCATLNMMNAYYYFMYMAFAVYVLVHPRIVFDFTSGSLLLLAASLMCFSPVSTMSVLGALKPLTFPMSYMLGYGLLRKRDRSYSLQEDQQFGIKLLVILGAGGFAHYLLNWLTNQEALQRDTVDFWSRQELSATNQAAMACVLLGLAIVALFSGTKMKTKILAVAVIVLTLLYNLTLSGRTLLVMTVILSAIAILHRVIRGRKHAGWFLIITAIVIGVLVVAYSNDWFGMRSLVEESGLYERFYGDYATLEVGEDTRLEHKAKYLARIFDYPFGGAQLRLKYGYSHDLYLDTYDEAGWFAMIGVVAYVLLSVGRLVRCLRDERYSFVFRQMVLCTYAIFYMESMIEPILQASPWLLVCFCVFDGYLSALLRQNSGSNHTIKGGKGHDAVQHDQTLICE